LFLYRLREKQFMEKITHDSARDRFEMRVDGYTASIRYIAFKGGLEVISTYVPAPLEGKGIASALTRHVVDYARQNGLKIVPSCSFTRAWFRRHPEEQDLEG
jgi:predicted GNAT family acetyltransferase